MGVVCAVFASDWCPNQRRVEYTHSLSHLESRVSVLFKLSGGILNIFCGEIIQCLSDEVYVNVFVVCDIYWICNNAQDASVMLVYCAYYLSMDE